jgi:hypothetical protein
MKPIVIIKGGTNTQRFNKLTNIIADRYTGPASIQIGVSIDTIGLLALIVPANGYAAIHHFNVPCYASYLLDMLKSFALHGKQVLLTVNSPQDIPADLAGHYTLIDLDK